MTNYLHVLLLYIPCAVLPAVAHFSCKCNIWKQKHHSVPENRTITPFNFFVLPNHYKTFPPLQDAAWHWQPWCAM